MDGSCESVMCHSGYFAQLGLVEVCVRDDDRERGVARKLILYAFDAGPHLREGTPQALFVL